jgi:hypothetical protein
MEFRWNDWNVEHIAQHGVRPDDAETAVERAARSFPRKIEEDKWLVWGRGLGGRWLQVVYLLDDDDALFVIHARELTAAEKRRLRRRNK